MIKRVFSNIKQNGLLIFIIRIIKSILLKIVSGLESIDRKHGWKHLKEYKELKEIICDPKYKSIFVYYPTLIWNLPVFQRPQQIAKALSEKEDILYIYCTPSPYLDNFEGLYTKIKDNLILTHDYRFVEWLRHDNKIIQFYSTDTIVKYSDIKRAMKYNNKILYEYIDGIDEKLMGKLSPSYYEKHDKVMRNEEIYVVASADKLLKDVQNYRSKNYAYVCNGVTVKDFTTKSKEIPENLKRIRNNYDKIITYYGALASWFDYDLLKKCAKKYPKYAFVLLGIKYDDTYDKQGLDEYKNIFYLGKVPYTELVHYTHYTDLLTIPFLINEITEATSPVKLFEYMAAQKPILTTAMPECKKYKSAIIGENHDDYIKKIDSTIKLVNDKNYLKTEMKEANENSWESKADTIIKLVNNELE